MASKRGLWNKFGRFITGLTFACFFLPFFGVSCEGMDMITVSGMDMAIGAKPGGLLMEAGEQEGKKGGMSGGEMKVPNVEVQPLAIVAVGLAIILFGLSWLRTRGALVGSMAVSIACLGALIGLYIQFGGYLDKQIGDATNQQGMGGEMMKETKVESGSRFGLWITALGLLATAGLAGAALREKEGAEPAPRA